MANPKYSIIGDLRHFRRRMRASLRDLLRLPRFLRDPDRELQAPTVPTFHFGIHVFCLYPYFLPYLEIAVQHGMTEHYGGPRHHFLLVIPHGRSAHAIGLTWTKTNS